MAPADKFLGPFIEMVRREFPTEDHAFRLVGTPPSTHPVIRDQGVRFIHPASMRRHGLVRLMREMAESRKIILHGLFHDELFLPLLMDKSIRMKCYWVLWGGDLYPGARRGVNLFRFHWLRRQVAPDFAGLITYLPKDAELARNLFSARGRHFECLCYPSNLAPVQPINSNEAEAKAGRFILVGNSADPTNEHLDIFTWLQGQELGDRIILCPLSYGDRDYGDRISALGTKLFGERFRPLRKLLALSEYQALLAEVDWALFGHKIQQAMGNTITLLSMGKTVIMRPDVSQYSYLTGCGIMIGSVLQPRFSSLSREQAASNTRICRETFSYLNLRNQWETIFTDSDFASASR